MCVKRPYQGWKDTICPTPTALMFKMSKQQVAVGVCCLMILCPLVVFSSAIPTTDQSDEETVLTPSSVFSDVANPRRPTRPTAPPTTPPTTTTTKLPRNKDPVYNVWEYAYTHDGPINTRAAAPQLPQQQPENRGNQCLWAIVSCCNAESNYERENCFEALGCAGAWFQNLCSQEYIDIANNKVASIFSGGFGKK